jgi:serine/threonine-protein kinase HipA
MKRVLDVWWNNRVVGQLMQNQHGDLSFAYAAGWLADTSAPPTVGFVAEKRRGLQKA